MMMVWPGLLVEYGFSGNENYFSFVAVKFDEIRGKPEFDFL